MLVTGRIGIVSAARVTAVTIGSISRSPDGGRSDADRHAATHVRTAIGAPTIHASAIGAAVIAGATNTTICKGVR
jgi:hypothetical protein